jgi:ribosomal protein L35
MGRRFNIQLHPLNSFIMKAKTHSGTKKRVKITATGKFTTAKIGKRHLLQNKSQANQKAKANTVQLHMSQMNER